MTILEVKKITKRFGGLFAVQDLDLAIAEGEIRGIIGPNGAGKTTLFNLISGVFRPTSGKIIYQGKDISGHRPSEIAEKGLVRTFQLTTLFSEYSVLKNVMIARHLHVKEGLFKSVITAGAEIKEAQEGAMKILEFMELAHLKDELALNLSHGHQRALGIAITLAAEPKLLLLDEPLTGMNPVEKEHALALIRKVRDRGVTILMVEHDVKSVMGLCTYISVINFGKLLFEGLPEEIQANKNVIEAYLGSE